MLKGPAVPAPVASRPAVSGYEDLDDHDTSCRAASRQGHRRAHLAGMAGIKKDQRSGPDGVRPGHLPRSCTASLAGRPGAATTPDARWRRVRVRTPPPAAAASPTHTCPVRSGCAHQARRTRQHRSSCRRWRRLHCRAAGCPVRRTRLRSQPPEPVARARSWRWPEPQSAVRRQEEREHGACAYGPQATNASPVTSLLPPTQPCNVSCLRRSGLVTGYVNVVS